MSKFSESTQSIFEQAHEIMKVHGGELVEVMREVQESEEDFDFGTLKDRELGLERLTFASLLAFGGSMRELMPIPIAVGTLLQSMQGVAFLQLLMGFDEYLRDLDLQEKISDAVKKIEDGNE